MKTKEQVAVEIATLTEIKPNVRHSNAFGDDHHAAIDAQIAVLTDWMDEDAIYAAWGDEDADEFAQNILDEALAAYGWMYGDELAPHEGWSDLVIGA